MIRLLVLVVSALVCMGCALWPAVTPVYSTPVAALNPQARDQLWIDGCQHATTTGCVHVQVETANGGVPIARATVFIEGAGGMAGYTTADGSYRWSQIQPGHHVVRVAIVRSDNTVAEEQSEPVEIAAGQIAELRFAIHTPVAP